MQYTTFRTLRYATALIVAAVLLGCTETPTSVAPHDDASFGKATAITSTVQIPAPPFSPFVPCANGGAGEAVDMAGTVVLVSHTTVNPNTVEVTLHANPRGVIGTGQVTGDTYRGTGSTTQAFAGPGLPFETTFTNTFNMIGPGPDNNYLQHDTVHMTVNARGELTADIVKSTIECR